MKNSFFNSQGNTRIVPISYKILFIFACLLLLSNFATNYINLQLSQKHIINLNNTIMISNLKELYSAAGNQYQIFTFTNDRNNSILAMEAVASKNFDQPSSLALAFDTEGKILFSTCADGSKIINGKLLRNENDVDAEEKKLPFTDSFTDIEALEFLNINKASGINDGSILFDSGLGQYFGVYKFQEDWNCYFVRAELRSDSLHTSLILFIKISVIILLLVLVYLIVGLYMFSSVLANVSRFTKNLLEMQKNQTLSFIDISSAPNDDVTYLAASFNALSSTINNLLSIFQKFVPKDLVKKAYNEHQILLEGSTKNLVMLFSDIRGFTYRTETLGNEIITLLNLHYNQVIHSVHENNGIIGSIIGDAILAVYGISSKKHRALDALTAAWAITDVTKNLREKMIQKRLEIEKSRPLTESEEKVYEAVLIDVGVGLDGGDVFYGNIGSSEHMTNTVIGDNVNSASRLEGLTRIYKLPVIVSEYIKEEIENEVEDCPYDFFEIDTVMVKGKTKGKKIYLPLRKSDSDFSEIKGKFQKFEKALKFYYKGDWDSARKYFKETELEVSEIFLERIGRKQADKDWSGIWTMQTK